MAPLRISLLAVLAVAAALAQTRLSSKAEYAKHIDPLLNVNFEMQYSADTGHGSAVFPGGAEGLPSKAVMNLIGLGNRAFPILIDCLNDRRVTSIRSSGTARQIDVDAWAASIESDLTQWLQANIDKLP